jgi:hypothetical protein
MVRRADNQNRQGNERQKIYPRPGGKPSPKQGLTVYDGLSRKHKTNIPGMTSELKSRNELL